MFSLTLDHLVWRFQHASAGAEIINIRGDASRTGRSQMSAAETGSRMRRLASGMHQQLGISNLSTVTVLAFNSREHFETILAVPLLGAIVNSVNVRLQAEVLLEQSLTPHPSAVVVDAEMLVHPTLGDTVSHLIRDLDSANVPIIITGSEYFEIQVDVPFIAYESLIAEDEPAGFPRLDENQTAFLFHSGGTTGKPKTYEVTHRAAVLHALSQATSEASGLVRQDRVLPLPPIFHVNAWGLPLVSAFTGSTLVFCGGDMTAGRIATILRDEHITVAAGVPTIWYDVCRAVDARPELRPSDLREVICGGSAVPQSLVNSVSTALGAGLASAWGMTETLACSTYERIEPSTSAGRPIPLIEIHIAPLVTEVEIESDAATHEQRGRLQVSGPFVVSPRNESGEWCETGDIASVDLSGRLHVHDREKDLIKSGGEWIVSAELEQHLCTHAAVAAAAVVGRPDPRWTERPIAFVAVKPGEMTPHLEEELKAHVKARFPGWWVPDEIVLEDSLPTTAVGKIDKVQVRNLVA